MATSVQADIVTRRSDRGLSIMGTRITLYDIMGHLHAGHSLELIRSLFSLTVEQMEGVMEYIAAHRDAVEAEYVQVLESAAESRRYWEERNKERFAQIAAAGPPPGREELYAKLQARKAERGEE